MKKMKKKQLETTDIWWCFLTQHLRFRMCECTIIPLYVPNPPFNHLACEQNGTGISNKILMLFMRNMYFKLPCVTFHIRVCFKVNDTLQWCHVSVTIFQSLAIILVEQIVQTDNKEMIEVLYYWPFMGESPGN